MRPRRVLLAALISTTGSAMGCFLGFGDYKVAEGTTSSSGVGGAVASTSSAGGGGGGGGGGGTNCGPGTTADFRDDFDDNMTGPQWSPFTSDAAHASVAETNMTVVAKTDGTNTTATGYSWQQGQRSLIGCEMFIEVKKVVSTVEPIAVVFLLAADGGSTDILEIQQFTSQIYFRHVVNNMDMNSTSITFDATLHRWWRMRESNGNVYFDTAPDGKNWTQQHSIQTPAFVSAALNASFGIGVLGIAPSGGVAIFDNLNAPPP